MNDLFSLAVLLCAVQATLGQECLTQAGQTAWAVENLSGECLTALTTLQAAQNVTLQLTDFVATVSFKRQENLHNIY